MTRFLPFFAFLLSGCIPPLAVHETGRTLGESHSEIVGGIGNLGHLIKFNYGVTDNLDLGVQWETFNFGIRAKYAFVNNPVSGWAFAGAMGTGSVQDGNYYLGDLITSYLSGDWEPYGAMRLSRTICKETFEDRAKKNSSEFILIACDKKFYDRLQLTVGSKWWFSAQWFWALEVGALLENSKEPGLIVSTSLGYKF
jgi:hypothetical protein